MLSHLELMELQMRIRMKHDDIPTPLPLAESLMLPCPPESPTAIFPPLLTGTHIIHDSNTTSQLQYDKVDECVFLCPHCSMPVIIDEINCGIFRHAVFKEDPTKQVPPHSSKAICDDLVANDRVIGCCKPFRVICIPPAYKFAIEKCEYI